jgi:hypothetical protein
MLLIFRKRKDDVVWHFHTQCQRWPETDFVQVRFLNQDDGPRLCEECARLEAKMFPLRNSN